MNNLIFFSAHCPKFDDIPKNDDTYLKDSTVGDVMYGDSKKNSVKVKLYRNKNSDFVKVHEIANNHEYIHVIDENGLLKHGIYRYKAPNMDTWIGSKYFRRGDRKEHRNYYLYRFNESGNIVYEETIQGKGEGWRLLTKYEYKQESFSWIKVN